MERKKKEMTIWSGDLNPRFSVILPPMIWILMESEEPKIKSKQASKKECAFGMDLNLLYMAISRVLSPYIRLTCSFFVGLAVPFNFLQVVCKSICILMHEFDKVARGSQRPFLVLILLKPSFLQAAIVRKVNMIMEL